jgi:hypothetical protein
MEAQIKDKWRQKHQDQEILKYVAECEAEEEGQSDYCVNSDDSDCEKEIARSINQSAAKGGKHVPDFCVFDELVEFVQRRDTIIHYRVERNVRTV